MATLAMKTAFVLECKIPSVNDFTSSTNRDLLLASSAASVSSSSSTTGVRPTTPPTPTPRSPLSGRFLPPPRPRPTSPLPALPRSPSPAPKVNADSNLGLHRRRHPSFSSTRAAASSRPSTASSTTRPTRALPPTPSSPTSISSKPSTRSIAHSLPPTSPISISLNDDPLPLPTIPVPYSIVQGPGYGSLNLYKMMPDQPLPQANDHPNNDPSALAFLFHPAHHEPSVHPQAQRRDRSGSTASVTSRRWFGLRRGSKDQEGTAAAVAADDAAAKRKGSTDRKSSDTVGSENSQCTRRTSFAFTDEDDGAMDLTAALAALTRAVSRATPMLTPTTADGEHQHPVHMQRAEGATDTTLKASAFEAPVVAEEERTRRSTIQIPTTTTTTTTPTPTTPTSSSPLPSSQKLIHRKLHNLTDYQKLRRPSAPAILDPHTTMTSITTATNTTPNHHIRRVPPPPTSSSTATLISTPISAVSTFPQKRDDSSSISSFSYSPKVSALSPLTVITSFEPRDASKNLDSGSSTKDEAGTVDDPVPFPSATLDVAAVVAQASASNGTTETIRSRENSNGGLRRMQSLIIVPPPRKDARENGSGDAGPCEFDFAAVHVENKRPGLYSLRSASDKMDVDSALKKMKSLPLLFSSPNTNTTTTVTTTTTERPSVDDENSLYFTPLTTAALPRSRSTSRSSASTTPCTRTPTTAFPTPEMRIFPRRTIAKSNTVQDAARPSSSSSALRSGRIPPPPLLTPTPTLTTTPDSHSRSSSDMTTSTSTVTPTDTSFSHQRAPKVTATSPAAAAASNHKKRLSASYRKPSKTLTPPISFTKDATRRLTPRSKVRMDWDRDADPWGEATTDFDQDVFGGYVSDMGGGLSSGPTNRGYMSDGRVGLKSKARPSTAGSSFPARQNAGFGGGGGGRGGGNGYMSDADEYGESQRLANERRRRSVSINGGMRSGAMTDGEHGVMKPKRIMVRIPPPPPSTATSTSSTGKAAIKGMRNKPPQIKISLPPDFRGDERPSMRELYEAASINVYDPNGKKVTFGSIFEEQRTIVVFLRHFWCPMCQDYMRTIVRDVHPEQLEKAGVKLVVIGCGDPGMIKAYNERIFKSPYPLYVDPHLRLYRALGMTLKTMDPGADDEKGEYVRHGALVGTLSVIGRALKGGMPVLRKGGDLKQLGGEFVLGPGLRCKFAHRMSNTRGHAPINVIARSAGVSTFDPIQASRGTENVSPTQETPNPFVFKTREEEEKWMKEREEARNRLRARKLARRTDGYASEQDTIRNSFVLIPERAYYCGDHGCASPKGNLTPLGVPSIPEDE
ncbi:hypothetical protein FRB96_004950, partial [Tulasnella sp. 330]